MSSYVTKNGVKVTFDNNIIEGADFPKTPPFLVFKDEELTEVNFDGYLIRKLKGEKE